MIWKAATFTSVDLFLVSMPQLYLCGQAFVNPSYFQIDPLPSHGVYGFLVQVYDRIPKKLSTKIQEQILPLK
jgi:hypothetical protein